MITWIITHYSFPLQHSCLLPYQSQSLRREISWPFLLQQLRRAGPADDRELCLPRVSLRRSQLQDLLHVQSQHELQRQLLVPPTPASRGQRQRGRRRQQFQRVISGSQKWNIYRLRMPRLSGDMGQEDLPLWSGEARRVAPGRRGFVCGLFLDRRHERRKPNNSLRHSCRMWRLQLNHQQFRKNFFI